MERRITQEDRIIQRISDVLIKINDAVIEVKSIRRTSFGHIMINFKEMEEMEDIWYGFRKGNLKLNLILPDDFPSGSYRLTEYRKHIFTNETEPEYTLVFKAM